MTFWHYSIGFDFVFGHTGAKIKLAYFFRIKYLHKSINNKNHETSEI